MKALLGAAGRGTRLGELTANRPKPMLPIAGVPMIERIMRGIGETTGITEFVLVVGYLADVVRDHFGDGSRFRWSIEYVVQQVPRGLGQAVGLAAPLLRDAPFLMTYGDVILSPENYGRAVQVYRDDKPDVVLGLNWVDDPWAGAAVYVDAEYRVLRLDEKPAKGTATTHWNNAGLFVLPPVVFEYTSKLQLSPRGEYEFPDAITAMLNNGLMIQGLPLVGEWRDVGTRTDYEAINEEFGAKLGS
jgi:NDP-sugar pyrophosphorylase family protein